jgi:hypothetical protein
MVTQSVSQQRVESPARWQKALERAVANGLEVFTVHDTGERMVTSASRLDVLHRTDGRACTCEAALAGDPVCQHRAAVRFLLGWLGPASVAVPAECSTCTGRGWSYGEVGGGHGIPSRLTCCRCAGTGRSPVVPVVVAGPAEVRAAA